ncbi:hypothetical protein IW150_006702, partial [Coemansia sp. RSA 2607]
GDDDEDDDTELGPLCLPQEEGRSLLLEARRAAERMQGVTDSEHTRRYSPSGSTHSNSTNYRNYLSSVGSTGEPAIVSNIGGGGSGGGRGPREWHLGRPSLDRLHDDTVQAPAIAPFNSPSDTTNLGVFSDSVGIHSANGGLHGINAGYQDPLGATGTSGDDGESFSDTSGSTNTEGNSRYSHTPGAQSPLGGGLGTASSKPTGMAARFGRWLPTRSSTQSTKPPSSRPNNATRLRPSSRQSNRYNYASDDGMHPGYSTVPRTPNSAQPHTRVFGRTAAERYLYTSTIGPTSSAAIAAITV